MAEISRTRAVVRGLRLGALSPLLALIGLVIAATVVEAMTVPTDQRAFLGVHNFLNILRQSAPWGVVAVGMTFVIISGGIDLSVGSMVALAGGLGILAMNAGAVAEWQPGWSIAAGFGVAAVSSAALGLFNGALVSLFRVAPFIATLSTLAAYRAVAQVLVDGGSFSEATARTEARDFQSLPAGHEWEPLVRAFGSGAVRLGDGPGIPYVVLIFFGVAIAGALVLRTTVFGLRVRAVGDNEVAARYAALPVGRVRLVTYMLSGLTCGIAAILLTGRMGGSLPSGSTGYLYELDAIAAVVIGGTRMQGGSGRVWGTVVGVLILGVINNMLNMIGVGTYYQGLVKGGVIIAAVLVQRGTSVSR